MNIWKFNTLLLALCAAFLVNGCGGSTTSAPVSTSAPASTPKNAGSLQHMITARDQLKAAHDEFKLAGNVNYAGHRATADDLIEKSIKEINASIAFAKEHGEE